MFCGRSNKKSTGTRKIIIPKGAIHSNETAIIEIPARLRNKSTVLAKRKTSDFDLSTTSALPSAQGQPLDACGLPCSTFSQQQSGMLHQNLYCSQKTCYGATEPLHKNEAATVTLTGEKCESKEIPPSNTRLSCAVSTYHLELQNKLTAENANANKPPLQQLLEPNYKMGMDGGQNAHQCAFTNNVSQPQRYLNNNDLPTKDNGLESCTGECCSLDYVLPQTNYPVCFPQSNLKSNLSGAAHSQSTPTSGEWSGFKQQYPENCANCNLVPNNPSVQFQKPIIVENACVENDPLMMPRVIYGSELDKQSLQAIERSGQLLYPLEQSILIQIPIHNYQKMASGVGSSSRPNLVPTNFNRPLNGVSKHSVHYQSIGQPNSTCQNLDMLYNNSANQDLNTPLNANQQNNSLCCGNIQCPYNNALVSNSPNYTICTRRNPYSEYLDNSYK